MGAWDQVVDGLRASSRASRHALLGVHPSGDWPSSPARGIRWREVLLVATALSFFSASQAFYVVSTFTPKDSARPTFAFLLQLNTNFWFAWALVAPTVLWLARRFPLERSSTLWRTLPVHILGVLVCTFLHAVFVELGRSAIYHWHGESTSWFGSEFQRMFFLNFDWEMMTYWALVGLDHALRFHGESRDRALRASRLETRLMEAQLQALQRQIQPHFLFNTLNSISTLMHRDAAAADAMLAQLADLLRQSFENVGVQEVSLAQELDFLEKYVAIEQARFDGRLTVTIEAYPDTRECLVPNLLLQPLVENAIKHGIGPRSGPGRVLVRATRHADTLDVEVRDDGVGVAKERAHQLVQGVGLSNTRARLAHMYGSRHRFEISTPPGGGLSVQIRIPVDAVATEATEGELVEGIA